MFRLCFSYFVLLSSLCFGQYEFKLQAKIIDRVTKKSVIAIAKPKQRWDKWHTTEGILSVGYTASTAVDTLVISSPGYQTFFCELPQKEKEGHYLVIELEPVDSEIDLVMRVKKTKQAEVILTKAIEKIPVNYFNEPLAFESDYQEVIAFGEQEGVAEIYNALITTYDKGAREDNINTKIQVELLQKNINPDWIPAKSKAFTIGSPYNHIYQTHDYDYVRSYYSKNAYSKWSHSFFKPNTLFEKYDLSYTSDMLLGNDSVFVVLATLKPNFQKNTLSGAIEELSGKDNEADKQQALNMAGKAGNMPSQETEVATFYINL